nr:hypothetical protein [uncultured Cohaesibacter sp.]
MQVHLVGAVQSEHFLHAGTGQADPALLAQTRAVIRLFHDRHIGVPPHFAGEVAQGFSAQYPEVSNPVRLAVYRRLLDAMDATRSMKQDPRQFDHVSRALFYDVCLLPLGAMIMEEMEETYLFSLDSELEPVSEVDYQAFCARFSELFQTVCDPDMPQADGASGEDEAADKADKWHLFWERAAHQLWGELQRVRHGSGGLSGAAFSSVVYDDVLLRLIYGLDPRPKLKFDPGRDSFDLTDEQNAHLAHPKQGGVVGIHTSSRVEDIEDMLLSEMVLPPPLLADKLLNSSFFARHRPPPLDQKKQVVLIGASVDDAQDPVIALAKACWLDAVFRMGIVFYQSDLLQSEIRFGQWHGQMGLVSSRMRVGDYSHLQGLNPLTANRMQLHRFFCDAGWLPGFLSMMPGVEGHQTGDDARRQALGSKDLQLYDILDALLPEASDLDSDTLPDFSAALMVVIRRAHVANAPLLQGRRQAALETFNLTIGCPAQLRGGAIFQLEDGQKAPLSLSIPGDEGQPVGMDALNKLAADLVVAIFQFYWEQVHG